jgi:chromosome segregation ATPase
MPCVYLFNVGKIVDLRKHYEELRPFKKGFLFKWGRTNDLKRRTGEHIKTYGNLISSTLQLKYFSPVDNVYEVEAENEIRGHFQGNSIQFRNHKELIILDKNQLPGARVFYEEVYKRFSSEVDKLLGVNSMLERDAVYMKEIVKAKNERIEDLNRECEGLRSEMFSYQSRELEYKKREEEYKEEINRRRERSEERKKREEEYKEEINRRRERSEERKKREEKYKEEISRRRERSEARNREMERMMEHLSMTTQQLSLAQQETKNCQDVLCQIAFLSPDERGRLANLLKKTRQNLEPFLSQEQ